MMDAASNGHSTRALSARPRILLLAMLPLGDTIWLSPTTRALRVRYPGARITALTYPANATLAASLPGVNETLIFRSPRTVDGARALLRLLGVLRARRFDWAITFTSPAFKWISLLAGIRRRTYLKFDRLWWLIPQRHRAWRATHAAKHYYDAARELDLPSWWKVDQRPTFTLPAQAREEAARYLEAHASSLGARALIAVHPGAAGMDGRKRWPADRFAGLISRLWREQGARALLLGSADERALAQRIAQGAREAQPLVAVGDVSLLAAFALIEHCQLFIGNDSAPLHAAATLGVPYVGIFGPTTTASFRPIPRRPRQGRLLLPRMRCRIPIGFVGSGVPWRSCHCVGACDALHTISVEDAYDAISEMLAQSGSSQNIATPAR